MQKLFFLFVIVTCTLISCRKPICDSCPGGNKLPVAIAGRDTTITLPVDSLVLDGSASHDPDGGIKNYFWRNISNLPCTISNHQAAKATIKNLVAGIYKFELQVTDDLALSTKDTVLITVLNGVVTRAPVANAGLDQTITLPTNTATLDGRKSYDSSGAQLSFSWKQVSGLLNTISSPTSAVSTVSFSTVGIYHFELTVSNSIGRSLDTVAITVKYPDYCNLNRKSLSAEVNYLTSLPTPYGEQRMVVSGNKLYFPVFSHEIMNIYDVSSGNWTSTPLPADEFKGRLGIAIVAAENKIFFAGGHYYDVWGILALNSVNIYDISTNTWSRSQLSEARGHIKAAVAGNKVVFAGGLNEDQQVYSKTVDIYELQTNTWSKAEMKGTPRAVDAAVTAGNKIFFIGGYTGFVPGGPMWDVMGYPTKVIDIYDASTGQWTNTTMQLTRENFAAIATGDKIYIAGGTQLIADVEIIDVHTLSKTNTCLSKPVVLYAQSVARLNHLIVFFAETNILEVYNTITGEWLVDDLSGEIKSYAQTAVVNGEIYILDDPDPITTPKLFKLKL